VPLSLSLSLSLLERARGVHLTHKDDDDDASPETQKTISQKVFPTFENRKKKRKKSEEEL